MIREKKLSVLCTYVENVSELETALYWLIINAGNDGENIILTEYYFYK